MQIACFALRVFDFKNSFFKQSIKRALPYVRGWKVALAIATSSCVVWLVEPAVFEPQWATAADVPLASLRASIGASGC